MRTLILTALLGVFALVASAADVTGKWTAQVPGRGGNTQENTFVFKADGAKLTGTVDAGRGGAQEIKDGKVDGDNISFTITLNFNDNEIKMNYKGVVAGSEIKFTRDGGRGPIEFTAKKAN